MLIEAIGFLDLSLKILIYFTTILQQMKLFTEAISHFEAMSVFVMAF